MAKYKLKTHKGTQKRISISGSGKVMRTKGGKSHLRRKRSSRARGMYDEMMVVSPADDKKLRKLLPYGA
jgi:large subunit ribosomal protein L35